MKRHSKTEVDGVCDAACLDLVGDSFPQKTVADFLKGLAVSRSHIIMPSPRETGSCYLKVR